MQCGFTTFDVALNLVTFISSILLMFVFSVMELNT